MNCMVLGVAESRTRLSDFHFHLTSGKAAALTVWTLVDIVMSLFLTHYLGLSVSFQGTSVLISSLQSLLQ